jgi:hypothetical protein
MIMDPSLKEELMKAFKSGDKFLGKLIINIGIYDNPELGPGSWNYFTELIPKFHEKEKEI